MIKVSKKLTFSMMGSKMTRKKKKFKPLEWVTDAFVARLDKFLPLELDSLYVIAEVQFLLGIPMNQIRRDTAKFKFREKVLRGTRTMLCVEGKELQPLLRSYRKRRPKKIRKAIELVIDPHVKIPPAETTPTDMDKVVLVFKGLAQTLDKMPKDEARDVSYRLALRYSRSSLLGKKKL